MANNNIVLLNDFTQNYIASILCAIAHTFGDDATNVTMRIEPEEFHIYTENGELDIKKRFCADADREHCKRHTLAPQRGLLVSEYYHYTSEGSKASAESLKKGLTDR